MIRVLLADDSDTARALLAAILAGDSGIEIVGEARDGSEAVSLVKALRPDVVTMDLDMPRLDGFAATQEIMMSAPTPIVVISALSRISQGEAAARALGAGALAVLQKPGGPGSPAFAGSARQLIDTVKAMAEVRVVRRWRPRPAATSATRGRSMRAEIFAIAASTGGPPALQSLLRGLPRNFPVPILLVQHIAAGFVPGFASWLGMATGFRVKVAEEGEALQAATVYVAPDERHLGVDPVRGIGLSSAPPIGGFRPSATFLFESVARAYGTSSVAAILTGMGRDGVDGLAAVRKAGGRTIAQDEQTSVIFGMPGAAIEADLADDVLPLEAISRRMVALATGSNGGGS